MSISALQSQFTGLTIKSEGLAVYNGMEINYTSETDLQTQLEALGGNGSDEYAGGEEAAADDELTEEQLALANSYAASINSEVSTGNGLVSVIQAGISAINNLFSQVSSAAREAQNDYTNDVEDEIQRIQDDTTMSQDKKAAAIANAFSSVSFDDSSVNNIYSQASTQMGTLSSSINNLNTSNKNIFTYNNNLSGVISQTASQSGEVTSLHTTLTLGQNTFEANSGFYESIFSKPSEIQSDITSGTTEVQELRITTTDNERSSADAAIQSATIDAEAAAEEDKNKDTVTV